jgi:methyl-accepting chemotaxis protein
MDAVRQRAESTAESMLTLADRAQAIAEIITTVNEIADQTNLLALNAAIEASRAGDAGKGFAVVASEVKSLAEEAKRATTQVRDILSEIYGATSQAVESTEQTTESVHDANAVVEKAEQTINELGTMVAAAADAATRIVASSRQQAASMSQVTASINEINHTAQQALVATQSTEEAARDLNALGNRLKKLIEGETASPHDRLS